MSARKRSIFRSESWNRFIYAVWSPFYDLLVQAPFLERIRRAAIEALDPRAGERVILVGIEPPPSHADRWLVGGRGGKANSNQPPSRLTTGKDIDETSLKAIRSLFMLAAHPAARQRYADLTVVLAFEPVNQLGAGSRA